MTTKVKGKTKAAGAKGETKATKLKEFLSNLATDARKLGEFLHDPEAAMSVGNLSEADKTALRSGVSGMVAARLAGMPLDQAFQPPPQLPHIGPPPVWHIGPPPQPPHLGPSPQPPHIGPPPQPPHIGPPPQPPHIGPSPQPPHIGPPPAWHIGQPATWHIGLPPQLPSLPQFVVYYVVVYYPQQGTP
jgi:hypothetical protein